VGGQGIIRVTFGFWGIFKEFFKFFKGGFGEKGNFNRDFWGFGRGLLWELEFMEVGLWGWGIWNNGRLF